MFPFAVVSNPRLLEMFPDVFDRTHSLCALVATVRRKTWKSSSSIPNFPGIILFAASPVRRQIQKRKHQR